MHGQKNIKKCSVIYSKTLKSVVAVHFPNSSHFLGAFAKLRKAIINFVTSVPPFVPPSLPFVRPSVRVFVYSHGETRVPLYGIFKKFCYFFGGVFFEKCVKKIKSFILKAQE